MMDFMVDRMYGKRCVVCKKRVKITTCREEHLCSECRSWYLRIYFLFVIIQRRKYWGSDAIIRERVIK